MIKDEFKNLYSEELDQIEVNSVLKAEVREQLSLEKKKESRLYGIRGPVFGFGLVGALVIVLAFVAFPEVRYFPAGVVNQEVFGKVDDWQLDLDSASDFKLLKGRLGTLGSSTGLSSGTGFLAESFSSASFEAAPMSGDRDLGFAVGGAKDIENFRLNIENGYLPQVTDITPEGLFYQYFFDTGKTEKCDELFCPSFAQAVSSDPISGEEEYYLSVGLNSGMKESDFQRKKLNLVVVLDISGSMSSPFNQYYYDSYGNNVNTERIFNKSKMSVATESLVGLMGHLNDDDRFGVVLYESNAFVAKPMNLVGETDMASIKRHVLELSPQGGTNMAAGMQEASQMLDEYQDVDASEYENRIIFLTDAMPNMGETSKDGLVGMADGNADDGIYTTFIGIGVDFQTELIESITKIRGANYYSVHTPEEFDERMDEGFEFMVTPLVFNLEMSFQSDGYEIEQVFGSPEADRATGELMHVNTLFPSKTEGGETKGGLVLLKLRKTSGGDKINLSVTYEDRSGKSHESSQTITFKSGDASKYDNSGIRKGIVLSRYVDLLKNWIIDERSNAREPSINEDDGIIAPPEFNLGQWEQTSVSLNVSESYRALFETFAEYLEKEIVEIGDDSMDQELEVLRGLIESRGSSSNSDDWNY